MTEDVLTASVSGTGTGRYNAPPDSRQMTCCPGCGIVLDHFLYRDVRPAPTPVWSPAVEAPPIVRPVVTAKAAVAEPGDIYHPPSADAGVADTDQTYRLTGLGEKPTVAVHLDFRSTEWQRRTLSAVMDSVPPEQVDFVILVQNVDSAMMPTLRELEAGGARLIRGDSQASLLRSAIHSGNTPWLIWFSTGAVPKTRNWLKSLDSAIRTQPAESRVGLVGVKRRTVLTGSTAEKMAAWFSSAAWHRGRPMRNRAGQQSPNGNEIHYVMGHFWAARRAALLECGVPDQRLRDSGLSVCLGEQVYQGGWNTKMFDGDHKLVSPAHHELTRSYKAPPWHGER